MNTWDKLSMTEKAEIMKLAVDGGIYDLDTIKDVYNKFAEGGQKEDSSWTMEDEAKYREWRNSLPDNLRNTDDSLYDMRGAYKVGMQPTLESDGYYHLQSRDPRTGRILKSPLHPTYLQALTEDARMGYYAAVDNRGNTYTQTWKGNQYKEGGDIHIKPSHRGRLTELKARTGKSESELYNDGNPAHKKMVVFARNARKWKHEDGGNLYGGDNENGQQMYVARPDAVYVQRQEPIFPIKPELSEEAALRRTNRVYSNYSKAKDNPLSSEQEAFRNTLRWFQDRGLNPIGSGVSNCTLTATQWVDPTNPIKNAKSIVDNPEQYNYQQIDSIDAVPGNIVIAENPDNGSFHTMMLEGFADKDGVYDFEGIKYPYKKGDPLMVYSTGGHDNSNIRRGIPLDVYTKNSEGKTKNRFYRYGYPNNIILDEIVITPKKK